MIYSSGHRFGHPRCSITDNFHATLAAVPTHQMDCGANNDDNTPSPFNPTRAEYATEVNGTIVVTTDGASPLRDGRGTMRHSSTLNPGPTETVDV